MSVSADVVVHALRAKFDAPVWAFLSQVRSATGYARTPRTADALAMSLWPSRGLELHGFEVKVERSDWLRELAAPAKAEEIARFCDRWWIVALPDVVEREEVPPTWGLLVLSGSRLRTEVDAPKTEPLPMSRGFLAALLRNVAASVEGWVPPTEVEARVGAAADARAESAVAWEKSCAEREKVRADRFEESIRAFEAASGVTFSAWDAGRVGEAVRVILHAESAEAHVRNRLGELLRAARGAVGELERLLAPEGSSCAP